MNRLKQLITEIHRRSLWQVLAIYVVASWAVLEAADVLVDRLSLPEWIYGAAIVLLLVGLPIVLGTAFVQEGFTARPRQDPTLLPGEEQAVGRGQPTGPRRLLTWRNALGGGVLAFALWGVFAAGWLLLAQRKSPEPGEVMSGSAASAAIAVLPFRVVGPELELWREGMVDLLSTNLDGAAGLRAIDPRALLSRWRSEIGEGVDAADRQAALDIARGLGAGYALIGSMVGSEREVRLSAEVYDLRSGDLRGSAQVGGSRDSVMALVDGLSMEVLRAGLMSEPGGLPQLALSRVTTSSLPALKAYLAGEQKYRRSQWEAAIAHYTRAVEADSTFALALYRLSQTYGWMGVFGASSELRSRAARFAHRLPERQALLLSGASEYVQGRLSAIEILEELTTRYLDDAEGWYQLGEAYFHLGGQGLYPLEKFRTAFRRAIALDPTFGPAYIHLIDDAFIRMDSAGARTLIARYEEVSPASPTAIAKGLAYALVWADSVSRAEANAALDTAGAGVLWGSMGPLFFGSGDLAEQFLTVSQALSHERHPPDDRQGGQAGLEIAYLIRGQLREARNVLEAWPGEEPFGVTPSRRYLLLHLAGYADTLTASRAARVLAADPAPVDRFLVGAFAANENRWDGAEDEVRALELTAQEAESQADSLLATESRAFAQALRGYVALGQGDRQIAVQTLEEALPRLPGGGSLFIRSRVHALLRYEMGRVLLDLARPWEAERYFRSLALWPWDAGAPTEFYLGQVYEALGDIEEAKLHYARFVRWWEDCDPELRPWRERGRQALARLTHENGV